MKKEINKSKNKKGVTNSCKKTVKKVKEKDVSIKKSKNKNDNSKSVLNNKKDILITKLKFKSGIGLNICIGICILIFIVLFGFIIFNVVKYFNNKIDSKNKKLIEEKINEVICFDKECFYIVDYSIEERTVYLISKKNISLEVGSIQKDNCDSLERKDIVKYLDYYKKTLEEKNLEVLDISIPNKKHLENSGCSFESNTSNIYTCSSEKSWIYSTSYYYDGDISGVMVNIDDFDSHFIFPFDMTEEELDNIYGKDNTLDIGLRVVIKVPIDEIK